MKFNPFVFSDAEQHAIEVTRPYVEWQYKLFKDHTCDDPHCTHVDTVKGLKRKLDDYEAFLNNGMSIVMGEIARDQMVRNLRSIQMYCADLMPDDVRLGIGLDNLRITLRRIRQQYLFSMEDERRLGQIDNDLCKFKLKNEDGLLSDPEFRAFVEVIGDAYKELFPRSKRRLN